MSFRTKLLLVVLLTIFASVSVVAYGVTHYTQAAFESMDAERTEALVSQFKKEFAQRGDEVVRQVENIANAEITLRTALDAERTNADLSIYVHDANGAAQDHGLDFVELVNFDGTLISSAQYPARVGYKNEWVTAKTDWSDASAFLKREELPTEVALSLCAVRIQPNAPKPFYIVGGRRLDENFLASLVLPTGMRALIYTNLEPSFVPTSLLAEGVDAEQADRFAPLVEQLQKQPQALVRTIDWTRDPADAETFHAIPLMGRSNELLGVFFVGSSRKELVMLTRQILKTSAGVAAAALFIGMLVSFWVSARITKPVEELAEGARRVAGRGNGCAIGIVPYSRRRRSLSDHPIHPEDNSCTDRREEYRRSQHATPGRSLLLQLGLGLAKTWAQHQLSPGLNIATCDSKKLARSGLGKSRGLQ